VILDLPILYPAEVVPRGRRKAFRALVREIHPFDVPEEPRGARPAGSVRDGLLHHLAVARHPVLRHRLDAPPPLDADFLVAEEAGSAPRLCTPLRFGGGRRALAPADIAALGEAWCRDSQEGFPSIGAVRHSGMPFGASLKAEEMRLPVVGLLAPDGAPALASCAEAATGSRDRAISAAAAVLATWRAPPGCERDGLWAVVRQPPCLAVTTSLRLVVATPLAGAAAFGGSWIAAGDLAVTYGLGEVDTLVADLHGLGLAGRTPAIDDAVSALHQLRCEGPRPGEPPHDSLLRPAGARSLRPTALLRLASLAAEADLNALAHLPRADPLRDRHARIKRAIQETVSNRRIRAGRALAQELAAVLDAVRWEAEAAARRGRWGGPLPGGGGPFLDRVAAAEEGAGASRPRRVARAPESMPHPGAEPVEASDDGGKDAAFVARGGP